MTETGHENTTEPRLETASGHSGSFLISLFGGALIGTAAGVLFASQIHAAVRNLRRQLTDAAAGASDAASARYRAATTRVGDAVDDLQQKGPGVHGKALSAVVPGAEDVKKQAVQAQIELDQSAANAARRSATPERSSTSRSRMDGQPESTSSRSS
jgi:gas vesicle protein